MELEIGALALEGSIKTQDTNDSRSRYIYFILSEIKTVKIKFFNQWQTFKSPSAAAAAAAAVWSGRLHYWSSWALACPRPRE